MTPEQLDDIEKRAEAAKSVTSDDRLEARLAWSEESQSTAYDVTAWMEDEGKRIPYLLVRCIAEETADLVIHGPVDLDALVAEVRRLRAIVDAVDKLHEPTGTHLVAEIDGFGGEQREIEPDSFEEITSREVVCMACAGYPEAPCPTRQALDAHERTTA